MVRASFASFAATIIARARDAAFYTSFPIDCERPEFMESFPLDCCTAAFNAVLTRFSGLGQTNHRHFLRLVFPLGSECARMTTKRRRMRSERHGDYTHLRALNLRLTAIVLGGVKARSAFPPTPRVRDGVLNVSGRRALFLLTGKSCTSGTGRTQGLAVRLRLSPPPAFLLAANPLTL